MSRPLTLAQKILSAHLLEGDLFTPGSEISIRIDQTLTQDATGTMAYLAFESMNVPRVKTLRSVAYIDHNTLQCGFENADDHRYIQTVAKKHGVWFSRPGNGICHQVHLERFGVPGQTLLGSDSHTPTGGGMGMLAIGAGGLDVAVAMGGGGYHIPLPKMMKIVLTGKLQPFVTAKDVSLELLRRLSVKGGVGYIIEWGGEGVKTLSLPERATITNMGAELGATTSIFPSDEVTRAFLKAQGREEVFTPLCSDPGAQYDKIVEIDLSALEPMIACPHSPDNVVTVASLAGMPIDQVCVGSCTNSSLRDMTTVAAILRGRTVAERVSMSVSPGSKQVLGMLTESGALGDILASGARLLECACGPCIGMGFSPGTEGVSLRTFNRNFEGRSGTKSGKIYLVSPETAAASAVCGVLTDPRTLPSLTLAPIPDSFRIDDSAVLAPAAPGEEAEAEVLRGPNIGEYPIGHALEKEIAASLTLKVGDNITTDHIMPAGAKILPYRSNVPKLSQYCFEVCDPTFAARAKEAGQSILVAGANYGQGSSREHAALVPLFLGVRAVVAVSFARIHMANLINSGILPLTFADPSDYDKLNQGDALRLLDVQTGIAAGSLTLLDETTGERIPLVCDFTPRQQEMLLAGGLLPYTKAGK